MLQQAVADDEQFHDNAATVAQLYIAQWHGDFGYHSSQKAALDKAVDRLLNAGVAEVEVDGLLSQVGNLPWQRLNLDLPPTAGQCCCRCRLTRPCQQVRKVVGVG